MQMVEDIEERILGLCLACELLNIINNQNIYTLIEIDEIIEVVCSDRISILNLEQVR